MSRAVFLLDLDRCTGCGACALACRLENDRPAGTSFRHVTTFNPSRSPLAPVLHLSLACNHCEKPACLAACPAGAYARDPLTGAVVLRSERCLGCTYCAWVCPYEAPDYDAQAGLMTKCTFCQPRLERGEEPACTQACPVDALNFGWRDAVACPPARAPGLPEVGLRPALVIAPLRLRRAAPPGLPLGCAPPASPRRTTWQGLRTEWPLAVFSCFATGLVAWFASGVLGGSAPRPLPFLLLAALGAGVSVLHLGRPWRLWRAAANLRASWVSREVVLLAAFYVTAGASLAGAPAAPALAWTGFALGWAALAAMDMVYRVPGQAVRAVPHSAMGTLTAIWLTALLVGDPAVATAAGAVKLALWLRRGQAARRALRRRGASLGAARVLLGLVLPAVVWAATGAPPGWPLLALVLAGEALDRAEFYAELAFLTPRRQASRDLTAQPFTAS